MKHQKGFILPIIIVVIVVVSLGTAGYFGYQYYSEINKESEGVFCTQDAKQCPDGSYVSRTGPNCEFAPCPSETEVSSLRFTYGDDTFALKKDISDIGTISYTYSAGEEPTMRAYYFIPNSSTYIQGKIGGINTKLFVLWRGSGANIIEGILFAFREDGQGEWRQVSYTKLPPDGGRTTINSFSIEDNLIIIDVKTSGPDRNYHETYVPKQYIYELSGNQLIIQETKNIETSDWKTYRNEEYGFEIKYPSSYYEYDPLPDFPADTDLLLSLTNKKTDFFINILGGGYYEKNNLQNIINSKIPLQFKEHEEVQTGNRISYRFYFEQFGGGRAVETFIYDFPRSGKTLRIYFDIPTLNEDLFNEEYMVVNKILSTFKFIEE